MTTRLLVLCAIDPAEPMRRCVGQSRFLGEAGLEMARRGVDVLCAEPGSTVGHRPVPCAWEEAVVEGIDAVYDRHHGPDRGAQRRWERAGVPVFNPTSFSRLCDDKLAFHRFALRAGLPVPETVLATDPLWRDWDLAVAKPRYGARGAGIRPITPGDSPGDGLVQRRITPDVPGSSIRLLVQRSQDGGWQRTGTMDRRDHAGGLVAGLSRGAEARVVDAAAEAVLARWFPRLADALDSLPDADRIVEVGVDVLLSQDRVWVLEFNARPGRSFDRMGRADLRRQALLRPFEVMSESGR